MVKVPIIGICWFFDQIFYPSYHKCEIININLSKCTVIRCTRSHNPIIINYSLHGFTLSATNKHMYLGVMLDDHLSWSIHVTNVANKATRMLNFLKRHLSKCSSNVKASAYLLMVRPLMENACGV